MKALLKAVREEASAAVWSQGVGLARSGAVGDGRALATGVEVTVHAPGAAVTPLVTLWPDLEEWSCECASPDDVCAHVAAAVIRLAQNPVLGATGPSRPHPAPTARREPGHVGYSFASCAGGLSVTRIIIEGKRTSPLPRALRTLGPDYAHLVRTASDVAAENLLMRPRPAGALTKGFVHALLEQLVDCPHVLFEGRPCTVTPPEPGFALHLNRHPGGGMMARLVSEARAGRILLGDVLLGSGRLTPIVQPNLPQGVLHRLLSGWVVREEALPAFVAETLTGLRKSFRTHVSSDLALPTLMPLPLVLQVAAHPHAGSTKALSVRAHLVYGAPARARLDADAVVLLGDSAIVPERNLAEEKQAKNLLLSGGLSPGVATTMAPYALATFLRQAASRFSLDLQGDALAVLSARTRRPRLQLSSELMEVSFEDEGQGEQPSSRLAAPSGGFERALVHPETLFRLMDGTYARLPEAWLQGHRSALLDLLEARDASGGLPPVRWAALARLGEASETPITGHAEALARDLATSKGPPSVSHLSSGTQALLRPYQAAGIVWLRALTDVGVGALLADDMGLGKTLQTVGALVGRSLVVVPTSVLKNWERELARFRPELRVSIFHGQSRRLREDVDVTLTTYALVRQDLALLQGVSFETLVIDEAQTVKNRESQTARALCALRVFRRIALSGTPVENSLDDLYSLQHFLNPGLLGAYANFSELFAVPIGRGDRAAQERLSRRVGPLILRRLKSQVAAELPTRSETVMYVTLDAQERIVYEALLAATRSDVVAKLAAGGSVLGALEALLRLRQAACHCGLVPGQEAASSSKVRALIESLSEATSQGHRALVFSQWTGLLDRIEPALREASLPFLRLDGATRDRQAIVDSFQQPEGPPVMLISLKAGGAGLNLTQADHVYLMDPWFNPATERQAGDRAHRIGQTRPVLIHRMVTEQTVEEGILALQATKRDLAEAILSGAQADASGLDRNDLMLLLGTE